MVKSAVKKSEFAFGGSDGVFYVASPGEVTGMGDTQVLERAN